MMQKNSDTICISCGIFRKELTHLQDKGELPLPFRFLDSNLHIYPDRLAEVLGKAVVEALGQYRHVILIYGDCHPYINDGYDPQRVARLKGINCCEIMLGGNEYRRLRNEGAFFVFEEWATRWKEIFIGSLGIDAVIAPLFMREMHKSILYVDTGIGDVPVEILKDMSAYFELPFAVRKINLDVLKKSILEIWEGMHEKYAINE